MKILAIGLMVLGPYMFHSVSDPHSDCQRTCTYKKYRCEERCSNNDSRCLRDCDGQFGDCLHDVCGSHL